MCEAAMQVFKGKEITPAFEHGQWWVTVLDHATDEYTQFSVIDATPGIGTTGLDFEKVGTL